MVYFREEPFIEDMALHSIKKYKQLIARVDKTCRVVQEGYAGQIACRKGCAGNCCRIHLSVFPIEAVSLARALKKLPREMAQYIRNKAKTTDNFSRCPLLEDGACLMYASRLVICRTHGLPLVYWHEETDPPGYGVMFCEQNFHNADNIDFGPDTTLNMDEVNEKLARINIAFLEANPDLNHQPTDRIALRELLKSLLE